MSLIGAILALIFLDPPLKWVVAGCLLATDAVEIWLWLRWRRKQSTTGPEGLVGTLGVVVQDLDPRGQVKAKGQIWTARSAEPLRTGTRVEIVAVEGLAVSVVALSAGAAPPRSQSAT